MSNDAHFIQVEFGDTHIHTQKWKFPISKYYHDGSFFSIYCKFPPKSRASSNERNWAFFVNSFLLRKQCTPRLIFCHFQSSTTNQFSTMFYDVISLRGQTHHSFVSINFVELINTSNPIRSCIDSWWCAYWTIACCEVDEYSIVHIIPKSIRMCDTCEEDGAQKKWKKK